MSSNSNTDVNGARYSAINAMENCELCAWLTYKHKLSGYKNPYAKIGIIIHNVLERYGEYCIKHQVSTDYEEFDLIAFDEMSKLEDVNFKEVKLILENVKNTTNWDILLNNKNVFIERRLQLDNNFELINDIDLQDMYFSGGVDLMYIDDNNYLNVTDYKSVRKIYTKAYMKESLQRKSYSLLGLKSFKEVDGVIFRYNFVRYGYISDPFVATREQIETEFEPLIKKKCEQYYELMARETEPPATPSGFCILCENRGNCKSYKNAFSEDERIVDENSASEMALYYQMCQLKLKNIETNLKAYVDANGPIKLKDKLYGPKPIEKISFKDTSGLIKEFQNLKIPVGAIYDALSTNKTNVTKLLKKFRIEKSVQEKLFNQFATKTPEIRFEFQDLEIDEELTDEFTLEDPYL